MNEIFELWSLPWHALQRSLANGFVADASIGEPASPARLGHGDPAARAGSWLARARSVAPPASAQASR